MSDQEMDVVDDNESENEEAMQEENEGNTEKPSEVYLPTKPLEEGEELVCDQSAYVMLHQAQTGAPCLSFDIIKDSLGESRDTYPLTAYIVAGTQAPQTHVNNVIVMKLSNLHKTNKGEDDDDDDDEESDDDEVSKNPKMAGALIKHQGCVNRIRSTVINNKIIAASWSELGRVNLWDLSQQLEAVDNDQLLSRYNKENKANSVKPLFTFTGHQQEGFAMDWCSTNVGVLATGDCKRDIHIWKPASGASWQVDQRPLVGHTNSVEDLQWSPNERSVIASCSVDKSIRIWDTRAQPSKACMLTAENAHESDVNVISWNKNEPFIVSGGDDGFLHIWDLRRFQQKTPVATFKHHTEPVTTVEWHPTDSAVFISGGSDNQVALWDLSVEKDDESGSEEVDGIPPQLLFIHQGQNNIKELHWHPQLPGVIISTAESGFNIFRTISV
ncbi:glutamate-rich WD repeat-containing protein 1 [Tribolium castaneum]|uniref:Glutamate-rich WD repeat-containing protein 1 n=1 Tax=Tribolium castaneum TaxID=7070 RepID=D6WH34_TRICA|nr:PREDICTED: glutamate-rich WD repeat-containing protein 1 [Tribolium castaneum]EFA00626.1 putative histone-binding protein Caf1-like Protein [Tribolium castaneum]|eukprot:XP_974924.1 PREDICTED: glutamate-rich WD repeat-containing protein 1 [Tribolium castaneum]